jgi:uncharacterized ferritin-like protein (DUF455 family)
MREPLEPFCRRILASPALADKLAAPDLDLDCGATPNAARISAERPARSPEIAFAERAAPLPRPAELRDSSARARCLARFAHHELCAVELFAFALLRWPEAPASVRRGWLRVLGDEQRHCRAYLERLRAHGSTLAEHPASAYFWNVAELSDRSEAGPRAFVAAFGLTLEQGNLDFAAAYADAFEAAGDRESAALCREIQRDEIQHVREAAAALRCLDPVAVSDLDAYQRGVPFPFAAARAKGRHFDSDARRAAGLSEAFIEHVRDARSSAELAGSKSWRSHRS